MYYYDKLNLFFNGIKKSKMHSLFVLILQCKIQSLKTTFFYVWEEFVYVWEDVIFKW